MLQLALAPCRRGRREGEFQPGGEAAAAGPSLAPSVTARHGTNPGEACSKEGGQPQKADRQAVSSIAAAS